jgi:hypothetical protein
MLELQTTYGKASIHSNFFEDTNIDRKNEPYSQAIHTWQSDVHSTIPLGARKPVRALFH